MKMGLVVAVVILIVSIGLVRDEEALQWLYNPLAIALIFVMGFAAVQCFTSSSNVSRFIKEIELRLNDKDRNRKTFDDMSDEGKRIYLDALDKHFGGEK